MEKNIAPSLPLSRPALFDWLVLGTSFSLSFVFPNFLSILQSPVFPILLLASVVLYAAGAWLKHLPLVQRMKNNTSNFYDLPYKAFLAIGHWIIIFIAILFSRRGVTLLTGWDLSAKDPGSWDLYEYTSLALATFVTWLVFRSAKIKTLAASYTAKFLFRRELLGDIFLCISVSILTFIFWERGIMSIFGYNLPKDIAEIGFLFMLLAICFILFYLPLRYLFLVEDHSNRQTWQRFLLIFGFLMIRSLFILLYP
jgi:hypothetical protein